MLKTPIQATSFWMGGCTSMFGSNYMIPPQGGDRRGPIVTREVRNSPKDRRNEAVEDIP